MLLTQVYNREMEGEPQSDIDYTPTQPKPPPVRPLPQRVEQLAGSQLPRHATTPSPTPPSSNPTFNCPYDGGVEDNTPIKTGSTAAPGHQPVTPATFTLPPSPQTPRTQRMVDRVGEEFKGDLPYILGELKRTLEALLPAKDQSKRHLSSLAPNPAAEQATNLTFKCERSGFLNALNMVDYCQRLANRPPPPPSVPNGVTFLAETITKCMETSLQSMEEKITNALTEQTLSLSTSLNAPRLDKPVPGGGKTFAQAASRPAGNNASPGPKAQKPKQAQPQPPPSFRTLSCCKRTRINTLKWIRTTLT